ncbi:SRPBCC family protein [Mycobacteroides franklinii]|uniref:SRPBCC family protein n=1 Tax=Mycobacteroides franklinii TaxID=948102 RepID=UPI0013E8A110
MLENLRHPPQLTHTETAGMVRDEYSLLMDGTVDQLWDLVTDVTRMGRFSPENRSGRWLGKSAVGAFFLGFNRIGPVVWATLCRVTALDPGRSFEFKVYLVGTRWGYRLEPAGDGVLVTEYREWPTNALMYRLRRVVGGIGASRDNYALNGLYRSLERIREITRPAA